MGVVIQLPHIAVMNNVMWEFIKLQVIQNKKLNGMGPALHPSDILCGTEGTECP